MSEFATAQVDRSGNVTHGSDASLYVEFYNESVHNAAKSTDAGRPIHDDAVFVRIVIPGGKTTVERPIKEEDKLRFPRQWAHFQQQGTTGGMIGTPLKEWVALSRAQVADFNAVGIFTVDQLAGLNDHGIQAIGMGGREWKAKARAFLAAAAGNAPLETLAAENERMAEELDRAQSTIQTLGAQLEALTRRMDSAGFAAPAQAPISAAPPSVPTAPPAQKLPDVPLYDPPAPPVLAKRGPGRPKKAA